jgi:hypothetical protein
MAQHQPHQQRRLDPAVMLLLLLLLQRLSSLCQQTPATAAYKAQCNSIKVSPRRLRLAVLAA